jgi:HSP20 family protein
MAARKAELWVWSDVRDMLARVEELRGRFFELQQGARAATWEPPVDMFETATELWIFVALPGVDAERAAAAIEGGNLVIAGLRRFPAELRSAKIHRMELPHGRFERRIPLPPGRYDALRREVVDGCLLIRLHKSP